MPAYGSKPGPVAIYRGDQYTAWSAESPVTGAASAAVAMALPPSGDIASLVVDITFSGDPGVFEIDVQQAFQDVAADYLLVPVAGAVTTATKQSDGTYRAQVSLAPFQGAFARLAMVNDPANSVTTTATFNSR